MKKLLIIALLLNNQINSDPKSLLEQARRSQNNNPSYSPLHGNVANKKHLKQYLQIDHNHCEE
ncbi:MAG: hypothetical protein ACXWL5_04055 [Candidatus Chromulinivorax sp.]